MSEFYDNNGEPKVFVSEVQVVPVKPNEGLIAFASCILNETHFLGHIAVFTRLNGGYRLVYPTKRVGERLLHYHHPITKAAGQAIEDAVLEKVKSIFGPAYTNTDDSADTRRSRRFQKALP